MAIEDFGYRTQAETDALLEEEKRRKEEADKQRIIGEGKDYLQKWGTDYLQEQWNTWFPGVTESVVPAYTFDTTPLFATTQAAPTYGFSAAAGSAPLTLGTEAASYGLGAGSLFSPGALSTGTTGFSLGGGLAGEAAGTAAGAAGSAAGGAASGLGDLTFSTSGLDFASALGQQGAGTAAGTGASTAGQSTGITAGQVAGALATAYSAYTIGKNLMSNQKAGAENTMAGAQIGTYIYPGLGTIIGGLIGLALGQIGGTTDRDTLRRREARKQLGQKTPLGDRLEINTTKGKISVNDMSYQLSAEMEKDPVAQAARAWVGAIAFTLMGEHKLGTDFQNMFTNAVYAAGDIDATRRNVLSLYKKIGMSPQQIVTAVRELYKKGVISGGQARVFIRSVSNLRPGQWTPQMREHTLQAARNVTQEAQAQEAQAAKAGPPPPPPPAAAPPQQQAKPKTLKQAAALLNQQQPQQQQPQQRRA